MAVIYKLTICWAVAAIASAAVGTGAGTPTKPQLKPATPVTTLFKPTHQSKPLRILGIFPFNGFSHFQMFKGLMLEFTKRGHQVSVVTPFPLKKAVPNYTHIDMSQEVPSLIGTFKFDFAAENFGIESARKMTMNIANLAGPDLCRKTFSHPQMRDIIAGKQQFDVVFTEIFGTDCFLAVGHKLKIPTISIATTYNFPWTSDYIGDVDNPAFFETMYLSPSPEGLSSFWRRLENTKLYLEGKISYYWYSIRPSEAVVREFFGEDVPSFAELKRNVSLVMVNSHDILVGPKPSVPRFLQVSGLHLQEPDFTQVPKDIKAWLDDAPNGVLYFTLGSLVRTDSLPPQVMKALTTAFAKLKPLRILWKYESSPEAAKQAGVPDNVLVAKWLPQMEILAHPNVKAFMTHGGLMSGLEAIYNGVPLVGLPIFGDQVANIAKFEHLGIAVKLDHRTLDENSAYSAIKKVVTDPGIRAKITDLSMRFRDREVSPADAAVWWTEYVVRHGGAPYLESPTSSLPFWQCLLLDIVAGVAVALVAVIVVLSFIIKLGIRSFRPASPKATSSKKKN